MEHFREAGLDPNQRKQEEEISFDESVCSAEFPDGCTVPVSEQLDQP